MANRSKIFQILALLAGVCLFVWVIHTIGANAILDSLRAVGFGFVVLLVIAGLRHLLRAAAWACCFEKGERRFSLFELFNVRLAGEAIRYISFTGPLLGEPAKAALLRKRLPMVQGLSSLVVENLTYTFAAMLVTLCGLGLFVANFTLHRNVRFSALFIAAFMFAMVLAVRRAITRRTFDLSRLTRTLAGAGGHDGARAWLERKSVGIERMESNVYEFYNQRGYTLLRVLLLELAANFASVLEVYVILSFMNLQATFLAAFIIEAVMKVINFAFFFVPGQVGVFEGGNALLLKALGLGAAAGVALALIEKIRTLAWTAYGLLALALLLRKDSADSRNDLPTSISQSAIEIRERGDAELPVRGTAT